jgi:hypothetical protein
LVLAEPLVRILVATAALVETPRLILRLSAQPKAVLVAPDRLLAQPWALRLEALAVQHLQVLVTTRWTEKAAITGSDSLARLARPAMVGQRVAVAVVAVSGKSYKELATSAACMAAAGAGP